MKALSLGECCADCFAAINYNASEMRPDDRQRALEAGKKLIALADAERANIVYTGGYKGFSHNICAGCRSTLAGDRWLLIALQEEGRDLA